MKEQQEEIKQIDLHQTEMLNQQSTILTQQSEILQTLHKLVEVRKTQKKSPI